MDIQYQEKPAIELDIIEDKRLKALEAMKRMKSYSSEYFNRKMKYRQY